MNEKQITSLEDLEEAALNHRVVVVPKAVYGKEPRAAAFYMSWQGFQLLKAFRLGMFIYEKPKGEKP